MSLVPVLRSTARHRRDSRPELAARLDEAICHLVALATKNDRLRTERDALERQLDEAGIELSGTRHDLAVARAEAKRIEAALVATKAELANAKAISSLPHPDDTVPDGTDCRPVQQRFEAGPAIRLGTSPLAGHSPVPAWATDGDDT